MTLPPEEPPPEELLLAGGAPTLDVAADELVASPIRFYQRPVLKKAFVIVVVVTVWVLIALFFSPTDFRF